MSENRVFDVTHQPIIERMPTPPMSHSECYLALQSRDARFDGRFFTAVKTTKIYCRPICRVKAPLARNCVFFEHAAQAEAAGYRPCLRCRPELAPQRLAWGLDLSLEGSSQSLASAGAQLLASGNGAEASPARVAQRLGVSDRHLRRIVQAELGVSPLQYLQTSRLLRAKQLLTDTRLPIAEVALACGFTSTRQFQAVFTGQYGLAPSRWRSGAACSSKPNRPLALPWHGPFDTQAMLQFFKTRQVGAIESIAAHAQSTAIFRVLTLKNGQGQDTTGWVHVALSAERAQAELTVSEHLHSALPQVLARVRQVFDLDADLQTIDTHPGLAPLARPGLRLPGAWSGFELAVRAVLGQQITVAAARTLCERLVLLCGAALPPAVAKSLPTAAAHLTHSFPSPTQLAGTNAADLGAIGVVRQRQAALLELAAQVASGALRLEPGMPLAASMAQLQSIKGIGPWTAQYIAMRALRWPDAWPGGDVVLQERLGVRGVPSPRERQTLCEAASQIYSPWRSYAVLRLWAQPAATPNAKAKT